MSQKNRTELRKKDFLVVRQTKNQNIAKVITPQTFQVGLDDSEFKNSLIVKGDSRITGRLLDGTGNPFIAGAGGVTVTENATGGVTISATLGSSQTLSSAGGATGIAAFTYNGSQARTVQIQTNSSTGGLDLTTSGLAVRPSECSFSLSSVTINGSDLLVVEDVSDTSRKGVKKITVTDLLAAAPAHSTLANSVTARDGLVAASFNNSTNVDFDVNPATNGGLIIVGGGGTGGAIKVDPNSATEATSLQGSADYVLIYDNTASDTRKVLAQKFADLGSSHSLSAGVGLSYTAGSNYNASSNSTLSIDSGVVAVKSANNSFTGNNSFLAGLTGSVQTLSNGLPYLVGGSNVAITTSSNGQVTIAASLGGGGSITNGAGIGSFTYNGSSPASVAVDMTGLSAGSVNRNDFIIVADSGSPSSLQRLTLGAAIDAVDRTAIMQEGTGIDITFSGNSNPATIATKLDGTTIDTDGSGNLTVQKVPNSLTQGLGIGSFSFDGSAASSVSVSMKAGDNVTFLTASDGSLVINATAGGGGSPGGGDGDKSPQYLVLAPTGSLPNERVFTEGTGINTSDGGAGSAYTVSIDNSVVATLSGSQFAGNVGITGSLGVVSNALFKSGMSGSLQMLSDGATRYMIGIGGVKVSTSSNGQIVVSGSEGRSFTAGTGLSLTGDQFSIDNSVVATLTGSQCSGNVGITGSLGVEGNAVFKTGLSGSIQMLSDGATPYIIGTGSISVITASSGQVIVSASDTSSIVQQAGGSTFNNTTTLVFTGSTVTDNGGGSVTITPVIGAAEDSSYTDGLFTDLVYTTPIGTAIDRFNEVLKGLAPGAAPALDDISCSDSGVNAKLSFGSSQSISGYTNAQPSTLTPTNNLSDVDINSSYSSQTVSNDVRAACFSGGTVIDGVLNEDISADGVNFNANSFGNADQGTLKLFVNNNSTEVHSVDLSSFGSGNSLNGNGSGFNLTAKTPGHFADGSNFETFQHRQGTYTIATADQTSGWNYARVVHTIGGTDTTCNYVEWVNDPEGTALSSDNSALDTLSMTGTRNLSGAKYNTGGSAQYRLRVLNAYRNVYSTSNITFSGTNASVSAQAFPAIDHAGGEDEGKILHLTGSATITGDPILNGSITISANVPHPLKSNLSSAGSESISGILLYDLSNTSTNVSETFRAENFRIKSGSYDAQADVTDSGNTWDSTTSLVTVDGLLFYNNSLRAPVQGGVSGDFRNTADGGSITNGPSSNVDYSGITSGLRTFYRYFQNTSGGSKSNWELTINGSGTIVDQGTALNSSRIHVLAKIPTTTSAFETGWMDLAVAFATGQTGDGDGCLDGSLDSSLNATNSGTFGTQSVGANEYIVIKIEADAAWTGNISSMSISWS